MTKQKSRVDSLGRRDYEDWWECFPGGCKTIDRRKRSRITEIANDLFIMDNFISNEMCDNIVKFMEDDPNNHLEGFSGSTKKEKQNNENQWKISVDWGLTTAAGRKENPLHQEIDTYLFKRYREFFFELDEYYCQWPYPHVPQKKSDENKYPYLGNTFKIIKDCGFQVQKTGPGEFYKWHWDTANGTVGGLRRVFSTILYLNDDYEGGETGFPRQALKIRPRKGRLVCTYSNFTHLHAGLPVKKGDKYLMFCAFESEGESNQSLRRSS